MQTLGSATTQIDTESAVAGSIQFDPSTMVDASAYGVSVGSVDNAQAIGSAQTAALQEGKSLYFDPGDYNVSSILNLQSNEHWVASPGAVTLQATPGTSRLLAMGGHPASGSDAAFFCNNVSLTGLTFRGAISGMAENQALLTTWWATNITISDCAVKDVSGLGILLSDTQNSTISNCAFSNIGNSPEINGQLGNASQGVAFCSDVVPSFGNTVENSTFTAIGLDAISASQQTGFTASNNTMSTLNVMSGWEGQPQGAAGIYIANDYHTTISGNKIEGASGNGIDAYQDCGLVVSENVLMANYEAGIALWDVASTTVTNNISANNNQLNDHFPHTAGISIGGDGTLPDSDITISGNDLFDDQHSPTQDWGIQVDAGTPVTNLLITSDNVLSGNRDGGSSGLADLASSGPATSGSELSQFAISTTDTVLADVIKAVISTDITGSVTPLSLQSAADGSTVLAGGGVLLICPGATGTVNLAKNYGSVLVDQSASVSINGNAVSVIGDNVVFSGEASAVISAAGHADIADFLSGATLAIGAHSDGQVASGGSHQTVSIGIGANATVLSSADSCTIQVGDGAAALLRMAGSNDGVHLGFLASATIVGTASAASIVTKLDAPITGISSQGGASDALSAAVNDGTVSVFASGGDLVDNQSANVLFSGIGSTSTILGGSGNTTVLAGSNAVFYAGNPAGHSDGNVFIGGSGASTIIGGSGGGVFTSGAGGTLFEIGTSASQCFVGNGGSDTVSAMAGATSATLYASGSEHMTLTGDTPKVTIVALVGEPAKAGGHATIDLSATAGGDTIQVGYGATGNVTLVGSMGLFDLQGHSSGDRYILGSASMSDRSSIGDPADVTVENWHFGDTLQLLGFKPSDENTMQTAIAAGQSVGSQSSLSITLSDSTVVTFVGAHPAAYDTSRSVAF